MKIITNKTSKKEIVYNRNDKLKTMMKLVSKNLNEKIPNCNKKRKVNLNDKNLPVKKVIINYE